MRSAGRLHECREVDFSTTPSLQQRTLSESGTSTSDTAKPQAHECRQQRKGCGVTDEAEEDRVVRDGEMLV